MDALFHGKLTRDDNGLIVGEVEPDVRYGIVFPNGTRVSDDGATIVLPDGEKLTIGEEVSLGGGYLEEADADPRGQFDQYFFVN